jgi:hypothetical protein
MKEKDENEKISDLDNFIEYIESLKKIFDCDSYSKAYLEKKKIKKKNKNFENENFKLQQMDKNEKFCTNYIRGCRKKPNENKKKCEKCLLKHRLYVCKSYKKKKYNI